MNNPIEPGGYYDFQREVEARGMDASSEFAKLADIQKHKSEKAENLTLFNESVTKLQSLILKEFTSHNMGGESALDKSISSEWLLHVFDKLSSLQDALNKAYHKPQIDLREVINNDDILDKIGVLVEINENLSPKLEDDDINLSEISSVNQVTQAIKLKTPPGNLEFLDHMIKIEESMLSLFT